MKLLASAAIIALLAVPQAAVAQTGGGSYCLTTSGVGQASCSYGTMGQCEQARGDQATGKQCISRSDAFGVTGLGEDPNPPPRAPNDFVPPRRTPYGGE
jgi:uncharacterized protein DUF3551